MKNNIFGKIFLFVLFNLSFITVFAQNYTISGHVQIGNKAAGRATVTHRSYRCKIRL